MTTIFQDSLARAKTYDITGDIDPKDRMFHRDIAKYCDCPYQNSTLDAVAEIQSVSAGNRTSGNMDIIITLADAQTVSVLGSEWNEAASVVQTELDAAAALVITDYVAGDIAVAGGAFGNAGSATTFTFSGASVRGNHPLLTIDGASLLGGTTDPVATQSTAGIVPRFWFAALKAMGVITGTDPAFSATPAAQYAVTGRDEIENYPSTQTLRRLVREATVQEGEDWDSELLPLMNITL
jgi:hypothetical protein